MTVKIINNIGDKEQNKVSFHPMQSYEWGIARSALDTQIIKLGEYTNNKLINLFQMTLHKLPLLNYKIGYLPRSVWPSHDVITFLYKWAKENKVIFIKIEPYIYKSQILNNKSQMNSKLQISKHSLFPKWTQILDLNKTEEEILKNMHSKTRYNIKLAQKKGVTIKLMDNEQGFKDFSKLYFETCKRQKYYGHNEKYHQIVWKNLKNNISHLLIAYFNNEPLAAYELFYFKDTLYYVYGGTSIKYRNLMASNLLMWEAIRMAKKLGAKYFDMWGSLPPNYDKNHSWSGFTRFKEGYGTKYIEMVGSFDLVASPLLYNIYGVIYKIRELLLSLSRNLF